MHVRFVLLELRPRCAHATETRRDNNDYFIECGLYESPRYTLKRNISNMLTPNTYISLNLLLGGPDFKLTDDLYERVAKELVIFVGK